MVNENVGVEESQGGGWRVARIPTGGESRSEEKKREEERRKRGREEESKNDMEDSSEICLNT